ncbi:MAG: CopG family transcriptional regulator [Epsilonproteobacteria bacterium]|nr:CopG family transcriptional regulator [Campylobacterota bacterium]NPA64492.1 CopG family transcriptional regulator [Campylobacterota bacterium]
MVKSTFTLPDALWQELDEMAKELGKKKSHLVSEALEYYFDMLDLRLAKKRSQELKEGKETISFEEIAKEYGL